MCNLYSDSGLCDINILIILMKTGIFYKKNDCIALIAHTRMRGCPAHFYLFKTVDSDPNLKGGTCFAIKSKKKSLTKLFNAIHFSKPNMFESLKLFSSLTPKTYFTLGLLGLYGIYKTLTKHYKKSALFLLCFIFQNVR